MLFRSGCNTGSDTLDPDLLYKLSLDHSEILQINQILNHQENDKYKLNTVSCTGPMIDDNGDETQQTKTITFSDSDSQLNLLKGYSYAPVPFGSKVSDSKNIGADIKLLTNTLFETDRRNQYFMELKSDKFKGNTSIPEKEIGRAHV